MKKISFVILIGFFSLTSSATPSVNSFSVYSDYLREGKIKVTNLGPSGFYASIGCGRQLVNGSLETVNMNVRLIVKNGSTEIDISKDVYGNSSVLTFTTSDFSNSAYSKFKDIVGHIPVAYNSSNVYVQYKSQGQNSWTTISKTYATINSSTPVNPPSLPPFDPRASVINIYTSPAYSDHYYTTESTPTISNNNFFLEGAAFYAFTTPVQGTVPIYVYYSSQLSDHYWTQVNSPTIGNGYYKNESIVFYAFNSQVEGSVPIYIYGSAPQSDHYLTAVNQPSIGDGTYKNEGIAFYAYPAR